MAAIDGSRVDQYDVGVTVDGRQLGVFETCEGGEVDSEETTYKLGAMGPRVSLGGSQTIGNVTVGRIYDLARDHLIVHWLLTRAGKGWAVVKKQPLDVDGNAFGDALTYQGRIKTVTPPNADANGSDAALITMEITPVGTVA